MLAYGKRLKDDIDGDDINVDNDNDDGDDGEYW